MNATTADFEDVVVARSHERPVVVDFWANWCGPCHALAPILEQAVAERPEVDLVKVDVDASPELAAAFDIRGIPAVKAFRNGRVVAEFTGAQPPTRVVAFLDELLAPSPMARLVAELRESGEEPVVLELLERGDLEQALELMLSEVPSADPDRRERLRSMMVAIFQELGVEDPVATKYRRQLAAALY
jgi:putative thioredoxin